MDTLSRTALRPISHRDFDQLFQRWGRRVALSEDDRHVVASLPWSRRMHPREAHLAREGEHSRTSGILLQGFAFAHKLLSNGARQIVSLHIAGQFIDIESSMLDVADHNVQSLGRSVVATVPTRELTQLMDDRPAIRRAIFLDALIDASVLREWVMNVGRRCAMERIAHLLCELAARLHAAGIGVDSSFDLPLTQHHIADSTGLTAVHTNRTLQQLRRDGLIGFAKGRLTILDWDGLADLADFNPRYLHHSA